MVGAAIEIGYCRDGKAEFNAGVSRQILRPRRRRLTRGGGSGMVGPTTVRMSPVVDAPD